MTARFDRHGYFERAHSSADSAWPELPPLPEPKPTWWERRSAQIVFGVMILAGLVVYFLWATRTILAP